MDAISKILNEKIKLTPMMEQYITIKKQYTDHFLFFRMGDFYELFFDDAKSVSQLLQITLTTRGKLGPYPIPMAGIPHHAAANYVDKLTQLGHKVAICEQVENPKLAKGPVKRKVTQIAGPGIPYDFEKGGTDENCYLLSAYKNKQNEIFFTFLDYTTGNFLGKKLKTIDEAIQAIRFFSPKEFLLYKGQWDDFPLLEKECSDRGITKTFLQPEFFDYEIGGKALIEKLIPAFREDRTISQTQEILHAVSAMAFYLTNSDGIKACPHIRPFRMISEKGIMKASYQTLVGLEILPSSRERYKNSLLGHCDLTLTNMGKRKLGSFFNNPLASHSEITKRQDITKFLLSNPELLSLVQNMLNQQRDIERILAKTSTSRANSQDLLSLANSIDSFFSCSKELSQIPIQGISSFINEHSKKLISLKKKIFLTLNNDLKASLDKGNLINPNVNKERDHFFAMAKNVGQALEKLEERYRKKTNIPNLRIKSNQVAGFFIEVSKSHTKKVPQNFERKQTLVNNERYITPELLKFQDEVQSATEKLFEIESKIFNDLTRSILKHSQTILKLSNFIALLDTFQSYAQLALNEDLVCPTLYQKKKILQITGAFHPLIKRQLQSNFTPHDITLTDKQFFALITGPNMAGKTTVMREMAIIQFMAQIGHFVPARSAKLQICDFLFSRLGAHDNIIEGQSTFMVEMSETSEIVRHATDKSLIVLDEVGRGTSTYDGLCLAWALIEHFLKQTKAITLFSTHYHELIQLVEDSPQAKNLTVETKVEGGRVHFLHRLIEESSARSYGIYVAKLAGLPKSVLDRAETILSNLETTTPQASLKKGPSPKKSGKREKAKEDVKKKESLSNKRPFREIQLSLFNQDEMNPSSIGKELVIPEYLQKLEKELLDLDILNLTPLQALHKLQGLQQSTEINKVVH